jgi:hypothetical protein
VNEKNPRELSDNELAVEIKKCKECISSLKEVLTTTNTALERVTNLPRHARESGKRGLLKEKKSCEKQLGFFQSRLDKLTAEAKKRKL